MTHIFHAIDDANIVPMFYDKTGIKLNYLISYDKIKRQSWKLTDGYRNMLNHLYLDSGAYSSSTGKCVMTISEYLHYLKRFGSKYDACFNLDDHFNDPDHNLQHQLYLEKGLTGTSVRPVPVIHDKVDPLGEFELYAGMGHDYIAIGSSASRACKDELLTQAKEKYPAVKIHLFGDLDQALMEKHRPYSADSAAWAHEAARGVILYWRSSEKKSYRFNVGERDFMAKHSRHIKLSPLWDEIGAFLRDSFGYEYRHLLDYKGRRILILYFYKQYENYLNSLEAV